MKKNLQNTYWIFIAGPPASGKTTFGKQLASSLKCAFIDLDTISEPFLASYVYKHPGYKDTDEYQQSVRDIEYKSMLQVACDNVTIGVSCVVVAPFTKERQDENFPRLILPELSCVRTFGIIFTIDPLDQLINLKKRSEHRDIVKIEKWEKYQDKTVETEFGVVWSMDIEMEIDFSKIKQNSHAVLQATIERIEQYDRSGFTISGCH